jgi:C-terminal processing protease CtpA/Prc
MNKLYIIIPGLFILGVAAGIAMMYDHGRQNGPQPVEQQNRTTVNAKASNHPMAKAFVTAQLPDNERLETLEQQLVLLGQRVEELEQAIVDEQEKSKEAVPFELPATSTVDTPVNSLNPAVTADNLVTAGIDAELAADIVRRRNEIDLKLLELRDRAKREGYMGTERYADELNDLRTQNISLRDEIGDEYYDKYLFASGQSNRVRVASVMIGSPAEQAGMKKGDIILNYNDRRMFNWNELQDATSRGERGEYVNVSVLRNDQLFNLWIPRGPLGIRLGSARIKP